MSGAAAVARVTPPPVGDAGRAAGRRGPGSTAQLQPGRRSATSAGRHHALVAADLEQRDAVGREAPGSRSSSRPITSRPSAPPSSARRGSKVVHRQASDRVQLARPDVRQVGERRRRTAPIARRAAAGRRDEAEPVADGVADGVLAGEVERLRRDVDRDDGHVLRRDPPLAKRDREGDRDRAAARADVGDPERLAGRSRPRGQRGHDLATPCRRAARSPVAGSAPAHRRRRRARGTP